MEADGKGAGRLLPGTGALVLQRPRGSRHRQGPGEQDVPVGDSGEVVRLKGGQAPTLSDIEAAERRIRKYFPPTPLEHSKGISDLLGRETHLKLETCLPTRVFK